jgi:hypothetical protein
MLSVSLWELYKKSHEYSECSKEQGRLRMFENMVLRRIFGSKWEEVTGGWCERHNDELHQNVYKIKSGELGRHAAHIGVKRKAFCSM